jgi:hypothetical protein
MSEKLGYQGADDRCGWRPDRRAPGRRPSLAHISRRGSWLHFRHTSRTVLCSLLENIVLGHAGLMEHLPSALQQIAPHVTPAEFVSYWFEKDSCLAAPLLQELSLLRSAGIRVYLATNQEHLRAIWSANDCSSVTWYFFTPSSWARLPAAV